MIAVVTGASSGLGEATARRLARGVGGTPVQLVLVARREQRLQALAEEIARVGDARASVLALDLTADDAPARVRELLEREHGGRLDLLVNNAGAAWKATFSEGGWENVRRTMELNFDAQVRLTEALLPLLRSSAPSSIVNISSTSGRVARAGSGAYSASKFALAGWSDALALEERPHGVHVGLVLPGFVSTEGFPQRQLVGHPLARLVVGKPEWVAEAVLDTGLRGKPERYTPRPYALAAALRVLTPPLVRRALGWRAKPRA
jgi:short-subunit dehydrogenase